VAVLVIESSFEFFSDFNDYRRHLVVVNIAAVLALAVVALIILLLNRRLVRAERLLVSQAALTQMGQMTAIIAHEIRNPLGIIKATAERLRTKFAPAAGPDQQLFDFIPEEVDRLNQITTNYLQFAAPANGPGAVEAIGSVIESITPGLVKEAERRQIEFECTVSPAAAAAEVDSVALRQILVNLVRNAIEAAPAKGQVSLTVGLHAERKLRIDVTDSGSGIDKQARKQIFDPFFTTKVQGTGLGLFVVKRLVDRLNGSIDLESQPGRGTRFTIIVPENRRGKDSRN
jgi:signal transduction histidine kinase